MPIYSYRCEKCQKTHEISQKISEPALKTCPECYQEALRRVPSKEVSFQFKGSGFYITDYGTKEPPKESGGCTNHGLCSCK